MKCPYCNSEMTIGEIRSLQGSMVYWQPITEEIFKSRISKKSVEKHDGIILSIDQSIFDESTKAYVCKECKKCIISFK